MDRQPTYSLSLFGDGASTNGDQTNKQVQQELVDFILDFHLENVFIYRCERTEGACCECKRLMVA